MAKRKSYGSGFGNLSKRAAGFHNPKKSKLQKAINSPLGRTLYKAGGFIGGDFGKFGAMSGEMYAKGIQGLATNKKKKLSFTPKQYVGTGASVAAKTALLSSVASSLSKPVAKKAVSSLKKYAPRKAYQSSRAKAVSKYIKGSNRSMSKLGHQIKRNKALTNAIKKTLKNNKFR